MRPPDSVIVQAPASTSNCGPGFDTLGIALTLYNFIRISANGRTAICDRSVSEVDSHAMVTAAAGTFFKETGIEPHGFDYEVWGEIPPTRGLGSSSTMRGGILAGLNAMHGDPLQREALIRLTARLDNAADNACAVFAGGFCIARTDRTSGGYREHVRFPLDPDALSFVAVAPDYLVLTEQARRVLPDKLPFADVVQSVNSLAFLVGALVSGQYERLSDTVDDSIHEPYRGKLNPFGKESIEAGCAAGAYTGWLSGSGSTVVCAAPKPRALEVGKKMHAVYEANGYAARVFRLSVENDGLTVGQA